MQTRAFHAGKSLQPDLLYTAGLTAAAIVNDATLGGVER